MTLNRPNASVATLTTNRVAPSPSGICVTCIDGCPGYCEVGRSAVKGRAVMYPQPFGKVIAGAEKEFPVDFSHFNIQGSCVGAVGVAADSDQAIFPKVEVSTEVGARDKVKLRVPFFSGAMGSTEIAQVNWEGCAVGAAIAGTIVVIGENVCAMDPQAEIKNGRIIRSPEMERRVKTFKDWYDGYGAVVGQFNVEDGRLGVPEYVIEKLGVEVIEIKWGQGAKCIGGEVKLPSLERALQLKKRGYIVLPDPEDTSVQEAFRAGAFREFERHSRLGMVDAEGFVKQVERLRKAGARFVFLKTGAYRPRDLALAVKCASEAKIDLLTVDGSGGGTGMSPWRMMNEWGIPTVYLECLLYDYLGRLARKGAFVPDCAIAGGLCLEDHVFKAIALGAPFVKGVCLGRATMLAAMVGNTHGRYVAGKNGDNPEERQMGLLRVFAGAAQLKEKYGRDFVRIPPAAMGIYTYYDRLATGLQQLMAGARKFALPHLERRDLMALTREAAEVSGIPYVMDADRDEVDRILGG